jgi:cytochrome oxidase Cu insertion factor (SCO1/SenC/PrrC family)
MFSQPFKVGLPLLAWLLAADALAADWLWGLDDLAWRDQPVSCGEQGARLQLEVGRPYRLQLVNSSGSRLTEPLPEAWIGPAVALHSIRLGSFKVSAEHFESIEVAEGGRLEVELIPLHEGEWAWQCGGGGATVAVSAGVPIGHSDPPDGANDWLKRIPVPLPPITLLGGGGSEWGLEQLKGHWSLILFGYTQCPDVCPTTLAELAQTLKLLESRLALAIRGLFVTVDPERDDSERAATYAGWFHPAIDGVSGDAGQIDLLAEQLGADYRLPRKPRPERYAVAHTADLFLIDPDGRWVGRIPFGVPPAQLIDAVTAADRYWKVISASRKEQAAR